MEKHSLITLHTCTQLLVMLKLSAVFYKNHTENTGGVQSWCLHLSQGAIAFFVNVQRLKKNLCIWASLCVHACRLMQNTGISLQLLPYLKWLHEIAYCFFFPSTLTVLIWWDFLIVLNGVSACVTSRLWLPHSLCSFSPLRFPFVVQCYHCLSCKGPEN